MALISSSGVDHLRLTVTDIARPKSFYEHVFGWPVVVDASDRVDEPGVRDSLEQFCGGTVYPTPASRTRTSPTSPIPAWPSSGAVPHGPDQRLKPKRTLRRGRVLAARRGGSSWHW